ncbi:hypothetical protein F5884DRAFT_524584 [Xylogone sp. PMI_703]|nr:hypothetical protein F5884DRAFT_524584 [Xylogone sp. PMI_703]
MSSPATQFTGHSQWQSPVTQASSVTSISDSGVDGVTIRPMRLKVLYTFDDQNKTNCLARWPHVLQIQTVAIDEEASIGVIDLKTCIQAIVQCSPELVATLGQDYTVYAYDFSECDTPLVGQGMLSWSLATASPPLDITPQHPQKLITGRVCKNILGLFSSGVKETLEVKLRLVPVPTILQSEYLNSIEKYRELSKVIPTNFDHNEWTTFIQSNPSIIQTTGKASPPATNCNQRTGTNMEVVNQLLSPHPEQRTTTPNASTASQPLLNDNSAVGSRSGTPIMNHGEPHSRPASRASNNGQPRRRGRPPKSTITGGNTSGYEDATDGDDNPAPKKRAKITKADWNTKSSFGTASDSLRVTASTAGSLRLFRPIAMTPATNHGNHLQDVPRAPTPVPTKTSELLPRAQASLRRASFASQNEAPRKHISPYPPIRLAPHAEDQPRYSIESAQSSPDRNLSAGETPPDISSSPPVMHAPSPMPSSPQCPSSPVLPQMPRADSGFMSGSLDDLFGEDDDCQSTKDQVEAAPKQKRAPRNTSTRAPRQDIHYGFEIEEETPGPVELLPTRMPVPDPPKSKAKQLKPPAENAIYEEPQTLPPLKPTTQTSINNERRGSVTSTTSAGNPPSTSQSRPGSRMMVRSASRGSLTLPAPAGSDSGLQLPPSSLQQSQTWCDAPQPSIEVPATMETTHTYRQQDAKKAAIRNKLEAAVANGEMPPFCSNCGAIETPTWRKAWAQECKGVPAYHEYSEKPGKVTAIIILERDSEGTPTSYQLIKKSLAPGDDKSAFKEFTLCNPCGIWMTKYKMQRPQERWMNDRPRERRQGGSGPGRARTKKSQSAGVIEPTSEAYMPQSEPYIAYPSYGYLPQSEAPGPVESHTPETIIQGESQQEVSQQQQTQPSQSLPQQNQKITAQPNIIDRHRASSLRPTARPRTMTSENAPAALRRAIQSSPARWAGTEDSPIEVDNDLGSTRRLLFPSPRKDGAPKVLGELTTNVVVQISTDDGVSRKAAIVETDNKENSHDASGEQGEDAELLRLFEAELERPTTPVRDTQTSNPFKTPTRPTPNHRPITRSISRSIQSAKSPSQILMLSQQTPSKTPSTRRRSPRNQPTVFESPFTATLNQLMSEANNSSHSPSRHCNDLELDFNNLPNLVDAAHHGDMHFNIPEDFFSTDVPMPSSPPRLLNMYEDPLALGNIDSIWNEYHSFGGKMDGENRNSEEQGKKSVQVKCEPRTSPGVMEQGDMGKK